MNVKTNEHIQYNTQMNKFNGGQWAKYIGKSISV